MAKSNDTQAAMIDIEPDAIRTEQTHDQATEGPQLAKLALVLTLVFFGFLGFVLIMEVSDVGPTLFDMVGL